MDMVLVDWTRMGTAYCLAGAVEERGAVRIVRPLLHRGREARVRNFGWSSYLLDGYARWDVFQLVKAEPAAPEPPHLEDVWVRSLRPLRCAAPPDRRRAILEATLARPGEPVFGVPLTKTHAAAYLEPGTGQRSLATVTVPADRIRFSAVRRDGIAESDFRVALDIAGLKGKTLPVKDHHLLERARATAGELGGQVDALNRSVRCLGPTVAVRLGLSRAFAGAVMHGPGRCWLMADGFFSFTDPQP